MSDALTLREAVELFVPDGFRDDDGVRHDGPHRRAALAELDRLEAREVAPEVAAYRERIDGFAEARHPRLDDAGES